MSVDLSATSTSHNRIKWIASCAIGFWLLVVLATLSTFPGSLRVLVLFHLSFAIMLGLALPRPRVFTYTFLAIFLFLGFWAKFVAHQFFHYAFIEPVGDFANTGTQWDRALAASASAALGVSLLRLVHLLGSRRAAAIPSVTGAPPRFYAASPVGCWTILCVLSLAFYACNFHWAFYETGVNSRLILPFKLNAAFAWAAYCGVALVFMLLADWESQRRAHRTWPMVWSLCVLGIVMSVSLASRASMIFIIAAMMLGCIDGRPARIAPLWRGWRWRLPVTLALAVVVSLTLVSAVRLQVYEVPKNAEPVISQSAGTLANVPASRATSASTVAPVIGPVVSAPGAPADRATEVARRPFVPQQRLQMNPSHMVHQVMLLTIDRWIGLEAMLALSASPQQNLSLLAQGLTENPALGVDALYQKLSHTQYQRQADFTYLTLPGAPAVLFYSGSLLVVLAGMFALSGVAIAVERLASRAVRSPLLAAFLGVLMANAICQMSFPKLWLIFVGLNGAAVLILGILLRWLRRFGPR